MLGTNGRAALIVPEGVLFNGTNQLDSLRYQLLTQFNLHSILSLPKGTLAPYTGVKVSVLFFDNERPGKNIWFYDLTTNKQSNKGSSITDSDFDEFISLYDLRQVTERSCLVDKDSLLKDRACKLTISLPNKEKVDKFDKGNELKKLNNKNTELVDSITKYIGISLLQIDAEISQTSTISGLGTLKTGKNLNTADLLESGTFPVYGGNGIIGYFNEANRNGNTIVIGKVGLYCGNIHFADQPFWLTSNAISLEVFDDSDVFVPDLAHLLRGLDLNKLSTGAVQQFVSIKQLKDIEVSLPSYQKQVELSNWFTELVESKNLIQKQLMGFSKEVDQITKNMIIEKISKY